MRRGVMSVSVLPTCCAGNGRMVKRKKEMCLCVPSSFLIFRSLPFSAAAASFPLQPQGLSFHLLILSPPSLFLCPLTLLNLLSSFPSLSLSQRPSSSPSDLLENQGGGGCYLVKSERERETLEMYLRILLCNM